MKKTALTDRCYRLHRSILTAVRSEVQVALQVLPHLESPALNPQRKNPHALQRAICKVQRYCEKPPPRTARRG